MVGGNLPAQTLKFGIGLADGHQVHGALAGHPGLTRLIHHDDEWFTVDVLRRTAG